MRLVPVGDIPPTGLSLPWPNELVAAALGAVLIIVAVSLLWIFGRKRQQRSAIKLRDLATYFTRRFAGTSSLTVFSVIESLSDIDQPGVRDWVHHCSVNKRIFNAWCEGLTGRIESDGHAAGLVRSSHVYLRELWSMATQYQEFVEHLYEVAMTGRLPSDAVDRYNKFVAEYNPFVQRLQDYIGEQRSAHKTGIEPASVKLAREIARKQTPAPAPKEEARLSLPPDNKGYILGRRPGSGSE